MTHQKWCIVQQKGVNVMIRRFKVSNLIVLRGKAGKRIFDEITTSKTPDLSSLKKAVKERKSSLLAEKNNGRDASNLNDPPKMVHRSTQSR